MSNSENNYVDTTFSLYQSYSYTLLLQVDAATFSYAVVNQNQLLVSAQDVAIDELAHPKQLSQLLTASYKKVIIGMPASGFTLVPKNLFDENHVEDFARLLDVKDTEKVFAQLLDDQNIIIYKTDATVVEAIEKFGVQNTVYSAMGWITAIAESNPPNTNLYIDIANGKAQFAYFDSNRLRFYNTFEFKGEDELAYFTSFVADELKLRPQQTTLVISGNVNPGDGNMQRLGNFYPKIELNTFKVLQLPGQISPHKVLALAALSLCE